MRLAIPEAPFLPYAAMAGAKSFSFFSLLPLSQSTHWLPLPPSLGNESSSFMQILWITLDPGKYSEYITAAGHRHPPSQQRWHFKYTAIPCHPAQSLSPSLVWKVCKLNWTSDGANVLQEPSRVNLTLYPTNKENDVMKCSHCKERLLIETVLGQWFLGSL